MLVPEIKIIKDKMLVGKCLTMSLADNKIAELWKGFIPLRKEIKNSVSTDLISLAVYSRGHFTNFNSATAFERWAAVEVSDLGEIPAGLHSFLLQEGMYAVFNHKGLNTDTSVFRYIFGNWLPTSGFVLDERPHFEVLGEKYKNNDPDSEEEIWIPVRKK